MEQPKAKNIPPVFQAVHDRNTDALKKLLKKDDDLVNTESKAYKSLSYFGWEQMRPLYFALKLADPATADVLTAHGASLNIFEAAALGDVSRIRELAAVEPEVVHATRDHYDCTPLHCCRDKIDAARALIGLGADVNRTSHKTWMPLHGRAEHGDVAMVELLLENGADISATSYMGTPLHAAVGGFQHEPPEQWTEVVNLLLNAGADINASAGTDRPGWTPLHHAVGANHTPAVKLLIDNGANVTDADGRGVTPLTQARNNGNGAIIELLESHGATG